MDVSREALLDELNDFEKKPNDISPVLEDYLLKIAKCGDTMFPWSKFKLLIRKKLEVVMSDFNETCPTDNLPPIPNVELFKFESMKSKILEAVDSFQSTPFTIQRLCELLTSPRKHYKRTDKFMRGIEKNILVVSTIEPRHTELNNNGSLVVNGILEVSTEGEMLVVGQQMDNDNHINNNNNNNNNNNSSNLYGQQDRVTVNGVPISDGLFSADPSSSSTSGAVSTTLGVTTEIESSSEDSSDGSTDSGGDYVLKEAPLDVMTDIATVSMPSSTRGVSCVALENASLCGSDEVVLPLEGSMENASEVEEQARQLLSQVAANIEENSLLVESSQDSPKFPVSEGIIDSSLELGFNLGKELNNECVSSEDAKSPSELNGQFPSAGFMSEAEASPDLGVSSSSSSSSPPMAAKEVESLEESASDMDPGILSQMATCPPDTLELQPDCTTQNGDISTNSMAVEETAEPQEKMDTDNTAADVSSSTTFDNSTNSHCSSVSSREQPSSTDEESQSAGQISALSQDPPEMQGFEATPVSSQQDDQQQQQHQQQQSSEEPMDQD